METSSTETIPPPIPAAGETGPPPTAPPTSPKKRSERSKTAAAPKLPEGVALGLLIGEAPAAAVAEVGALLGARGKSRAHLAAAVLTGPEGLRRVAQYFTGVLGDPPGSRPFRAMVDTPSATRLTAAFRAFGLRDADAPDDLIQRAERVVAAVADIKPDTASLLAGLFSE